LDLAQGEARSQSTGRHGVLELPVHHGRGHPLFADRQQPAILPVLATRRAAAMPPLPKQKPPQGFSARRTLQKALADLEIAIEALLRLTLSRGPGSLSEERAVLASWKVRSLAVCFLAFAALTGDPTCGSPYIRSRRQS